MNLIKCIMFFAIVCTALSYGDDSLNVGYWPTNDLFKPGDAIQISMFPDTTILPNGVYPINEDGFIDLPRIGLLNVKDMNEKKLTEICKTTYSGHLRYLEFKIRPMIRISCLGGFRMPGLYWVNPKSSLWEVVQIAGGTSDEKGIKEMKLERNGKVVSKDLTNAFQNGKSLEAEGFLSGDQITVNSQDRRTGAEIITQIILPIITSSLSIAMTSLTIMTLQEN